MPGSASRSIKFGFVAYKDHHKSDEYVTKPQDLVDEPNIVRFIGTLSANGGGDGPEAVLDGLYDSVYKISWRDRSLRYIFHIADAPGHGTRFTGGSGGDSFPSGCPCGRTIEEISAKMKEKKIRYKLLKIGSYPNIMSAEFKKVIEGFEECELDSAIQLEMKVSGILVRDI
jgi:hypothetical protein